MANITENPDYRLVMTFLQNIRPGDMDQESSEQLMMIGQRIKAGGALTDREREMFEAVVSNMPQMPETEMSYDVDGGTESMTPSNMESLRNSGQITEDEYTYMVDGQPQAMTPSQMGGMQSSGAITPTRAPSNVMNMDDAIAAGLVNPTRPQARPMMTSPRPQMRR
jgi:hypothetical protein